jgi:hypothetical protein
MCVLRATGVYFVHLERRELFGSHVGRRARGGGGGGGGKFIQEEEEEEFY